MGTWTPTPDGLRRRARCHAVDSTAGLLASMDEQDPPPIDAGADLDGVVIDPERFKTVRVPPVVDPRLGVMLAKSSGVATQVTATSAPPVE